MIEERSRRKVNNTNGREADTCVEFHEPKEMRQCVIFRNQSEAVPCVTFRERDNQTGKMNTAMQDENSQKSISVLIIPDGSGILVSKQFSNSDIEENGVCESATFWKNLEEFSPEERKIIEQQIRKGNVVCANAEEHRFVLGHHKVGHKMDESAVREIQEVTSLPYAAWLPGFVKKDGWIYSVGDSGDPQKLMQCEISCLEVRELYDMDHQQKQRLLKVQVKTCAEQQIFLIDLHNLSSRLIKEIESVRGIQIAAGVNVTREIKNLLSLLSAKAPVRKILIEQGWQQINGHQYFVYDDRLQIPDFEVECGSHISKNASVTPWYIFQMALAVFNEQKLAAPILLYALYGVTHYLFVAAKKRPTTILFLAGETGSLKTSLSKVFFQLFNTEEDAPVISFQSTQAALDPAIKMAKDTILLMDDYCINSTMTRESRVHMQAILDRLIRLYGDGTARRKSDLKANLIEAPRASGGAVVTGEVTAEGRSSCLRLLTVEVKKGQISGENLLHFQNDPSLWPTFMEHYIMYIETNFDQIVKKISSQYQNLRFESKTYFQEPRSIDHFVELRLLVEILCGFLRTSGVKEEKLQQICILFETGILEYIAQSEQISKAEDPYQALLMALYEIITDGTIKLAHSADECNQGKEFDGYRNGNEIYADASKFKNALECRLKRKHATCYEAKGNRIFKVLHDKFRIIHKFSNGDNATYLTKLRKNGVRVNAVLIDMDVLEREVDGQNQD